MKNSEKEMEMKNISSEIIQFHPEFSKLSRIDRKNIEIELLSAQVKHLETQRNVLQKFVKTQESFHQEVLQNEIEGAEYSANEKVNEVYIDMLEFNMKIMNFERELYKFYDSDKLISEIEDYKKKILKMKNQHQLELQIMREKYENETKKIKEEVEKLKRRFIELDNPGQARSPQTPNLSLLETPIQSNNFKNPEVFSSKRKRREHNSISKVGRKKRKIQTPSPDSNILNMKNILSTKKKKTPRLKRSL